MLLRALVLHLWQSVFAASRLWEFGSLHFKLPLCDVEQLRLFAVHLSHSMRAANRLNLSISAHCTPTCVCQVSCCFVRSFCTYGNQCLRQVVSGNSGHCTSNCLYVISSSFVCSLCTYRTRCVLRIASISAFRLTALPPASARSHAASCARSAPMAISVCGKSSLGIRVTALQTASM